uniref:Reverse transcriptase domain-containing protein n=1 Tax=Tanacetum cinerariifolium TaxID=118510 RepID=A0A6L2KJ71_TANCI|nr:hypothetical protein [Tanacetum cinerariifolium]
MGGNVNKDGNVNVVDVEDGTCKRVPVCKGEVTGSSIMLIYGNGKNQPVSKLESGVKIPPRPRAKREESYELISMFLKKWKTERIRREHADYINRMEMLFTINPRPHHPLNANTNVELFSSLPILIQDSDPHQEEIDVVTVTNDVLPPSVENDDSDEEEVDADGDLRIDNSNSNSEHEYSESKDSSFDNPPVPLPPSEPPDKEFDFEIDFGNEISVVRSAIVKFECIDARVKFDVLNDENDVLSYFMFDKVISLLFAESEDTIFDPGISN